MSVSYPVLSLTRPLSGEVPANRFVGVDNALAGAGENTLGVTQHYGKDEDTAVDVLGAVPVESGGAVTEGGLVESDAAGRAINKTSGAAVARALQAATAPGQRILCVLIPN